MSDTASVRSPDKLIHIEGSHGSILVHYPSGHIVECDHCDCEDCTDGSGYESYRWFDPAGFEDCAIEHGATDILFTSFVCERGIFTPPMRSSHVTDKHGEWVFQADLCLLTDQRSR